MVLPNMIVLRKTRTRLLCKATRFIVGDMRNELLGLNR